MRQERWPISHRIQGRWDFPPGYPLLLATALTASVVTSTPALAPAAEPEPSQERPLEELELLKEETVSIAARREQPISQAPSEVFVITDEDIRQSGAIDIPTLLRRIPGMEVMQTTGADFNVSVRGDNQPQSNKLLVMVDGRVIYVDVQGTVFWRLLPVTLPEIKRIEVLKGPASAVWGFNAFDGVVNIITKSPEEMKGTTLQFGGGNFGTITASAIQAGKVGKFGYRLSLGQNQNSQWDNHDALAFRDNLFNILTEYAVSSESKLFLAGGLVDSNRFDGQISQDTVTSQKPQQGYTYVGYEAPNFFLRGFWNRYYAQFLSQFNPIISPFLTLTDLSGNTNGTATSDTYNVDAQHFFELFPGTRLTYGVNYRHNTLSGGTIAQFTREDRLGLFFQDEWRMAKMLTLVAGARYDMDTFINPTISPRIAFLFNPVPEHTIRLSGSVAYRPPTMYETNNAVLVTSVFPVPPTMVQGNPNLAPEQIISYEATYQGWFLKHRLRVRGAAFFNHISDLISARTLSPTLATFVNDSGSADIHGAEAGVELLATKWLTAFANYSYQQIHQSFTGRIQRAGPSDKFNIGARGDWDNGLSAEAIYHYYGAVTYPPGQSFTDLAQTGLITLPDQHVGGYNLLNLRGGYRFWQQRAAAGYMREAEVAVSVFNALDDKAKEYPLGEEIGRRIMGWLTLKF